MSFFQRKSYPSGDGVDNLLKYFKRVCVCVVFISLNFSIQNKDQQIGTKKKLKNDNNVDQFVIIKIILLVIEN